MTSEEKKRETLKRLQTPEPDEFPTGEYVEQPIGSGFAFSTAGTFTLGEFINPVGIGEYVDAPIYIPGCTKP